MHAVRNNPVWRFGSLFLIGISLSIGWGIRGNFGHQYGAAFAGSLAAIAVAVLSGREDWRQRIPYFAFFGALGWGFGATQSYMQVLSYTESGHGVSQWYGYSALFVIGFLWAALGGAGIAFAAAAGKSRIVTIFKPLFFVFGAWFVFDLIEDPIAQWLSAGVTFDATWARQRDPFYWFDAGYLPALTALAGLGIYDIYQRWRDRDKFYLPALAALGAFSGYLIQLLLSALQIDGKLASALTYFQGDPSYINPETGKQAYETSNLLNNWPQFFNDYPQHIGWIVGLALGITAYFVLFGKFRNGASLFVYMGVGWLLAFLVFPVLGSLFLVSYGGLRMTPPLADDWAGIAGVFAGTSIWMWRNNLRPVAIASVISGTIGGLGFSGMQWVKQLMMSFGNPRILEARGILPGSPEFISVTSAWAKWQGQNWHSFLEQSYGFVNGIAIAVAIGFLVTRIKIHTDQEEMDSVNSGKRWLRAFSALAIMLGLTYFNVVKNVQVWSENLNPKVWYNLIPSADGTTHAVPALWDLPYLGRLPGIDFLQLTPEGWFNLTWFLLVAACILIVIRHYRSPLEIIPQSPMAKGQLIFLIILWIMTVANFERELTGWHPNRLLTEWVILVNVLIATVLIVLLPKSSETFEIQEEQNYPAIYRKVWSKSLMVLALSAVLFMTTNRFIYSYPEYNKLDLKTYRTRFGPKATWKVNPTFKKGEHSQ